MTPSPTSAAWALERLFASKREQFARQCWGQTQLLACVEDRGGDTFTDLFSLDAVDELIAHRGLRAPFLRMAKAGATLPDAAFTSGGGIGAGVGDQVNDDSVRRLFAGGATIVLQGLHRTWEPIKTFTQTLAAELGHPVQVNAYVTPPQNQGFSDHYDIHDVFVLQIHGEKEWTIHDPVWPAPLRDQPWADRKEEVERAAQQPPSLQAVLRPGDCLYLPRGYIHAAKARGDISIHLTIGIHSWTRHHLAEAMLDAVRRGLGEQAAVRSSLALGVDVGDASQLGTDAEATKAALLAAIQAVDAGELAVALQAKARAAQRPESLPPLAQLAAADALDITDTLNVRGGLLAAVEATGDGRLAVRSRAGRVLLPETTGPALRRLLEGEPVAVADLAPDAREAVATARVLLTEGVAVRSS